MNAHTANAFPPRKFSVGLTGGIGSGKSTVAGLFRECGAAVIDSDAVSHRLTQAGGAAIHLIRAAFGDDYIDDSGALDRRRMRQLVFSDAAAKQRLEAILHPLIRDEVLAQANAAGTAPYLLLVIPLLLEAAGYAGLVQRILVVDCTEETQVERTIRRSGLNAAEVHAIMAQQLDRNARLSRADDVIYNDGGLSSLHSQVVQLHRRYLSLASGTI
jgi:dephospho-CoA kinase